MEAWLIFSFMVVVGGGMCVWDRFLFGTWYTPITVLFAPFITVVFLVLALGPAMGFFPLYPETIWWFVWGMLMFWAGGLVFGFGAGNAIGAGIARLPQIQFPERIRHLGVAVCWFCNFILIIGFVMSIRKTGMGLAGVATEDFQVYYSQGIFGWIRVLLMVMVVFLIGNGHRNRLLSWLTIGVSLLMFLVFQVKTLLFLVIVGGLYFRVLMGNIRMSLIKMISFAFLGICLFFLTYLVFAVSENTELATSMDWYKHLVTLVFHYFFAGILSFSEWLKNGLPDPDWKFLFYPWVNFHAHLTQTWHISTRVDFVSEYAAVISNDPLFAKGSNVHTLFGNAFIYLGGLAGSVYLLCLGFISYGLFYLATTTANIWILTLCAFTGGIISESWFNNTFYHFFFIQAVAYCGLLYGINFVLDSFSQTSSGSDPYPRR